MIDGDLNKMSCQQRQYIQLFAAAELFNFGLSSNREVYSRWFTCRSGSVVRTSDPACLLAHLPEIGWLRWCLSVGFIAGKMLLGISNLNCPGDSLSQTLTTTGPRRQGNLKLLIPDSCKDMNITDAR